MIVTYTQDDGTAERMDTDDLSALEAAAIEEAMDDVPWRAIEARLQAQDPTALRAIVWAFRRREQSGLKFADVDVPGWRRRLKARLTRDEIADALTNIMTEALSKSEDSMIDAVTPHLRKLADDPAEVDAALDELGKGHLTRHAKESAA
ncbi:hypothetical protein JL475_24245 [Streptomyces sp. M2CJ-2]|uniref:hypothetical protein n=1 Tax=Streptomyces sp. M2CJ-2 TaxID=2803948 RepID=UPI001925C179|nr:hypothetical protein [Streptomyces sp. M2CJ-2]MBL3669046.1 hypothetical protein [Streptomyces sp. M2CJ-2]